MWNTNTSYLLLSMWNRGNYPSAIPYSWEERDTRGLEGSWEISLSPSFCSLFSLFSSRKAVGQKEINKRIFFVLQHRRTDTWPVLSLLLSTAFIDDAAHSCDCRSILSQDDRITVPRDSSTSLFSLFFEFLPVAWLTTYLELIGIVRFQRVVRWY